MTSPLPSLHSRVKRHTSSVPGKSGGARNEPGSATNIGSPAPRPARPFPPFGHESPCTVATTDDQHMYTNNNSLYTLYYTTPTDWVILYVSGWGHAHPTWTFWALPFLGRWIRRHLRDETLPSSSADERGPRGRSRPVPALRVSSIDVETWGEKPSHEGFGAKVGRSFWRCLRT